jgi:2-phospho-L-lactate/phosphoenolpyruvate guanylyltransferase
VRVVLIAAKQLAFAKTRLAPALPAAAERIALAEAMFRDVLNAALSARAADRVAVVTSDSKLIVLARSVSAFVVDEEFPRGLNVAVRLAIGELMSIGATCVCTVLSDIPLVTGEDIDAAFTAMPRGERGVVLVPSRDFSGTNMIARMPPDVISTQFGRMSLVRHRDDCRHHAIPCEIVRLQRPALDLDVPADLIEFARMPSMTHTQSNIARLGLFHG